jgi:hypothetical protein
MATTGNCPHCGAWRAAGPTCPACGRAYDAPVAPSAPPAPPPGPPVRQVPGPVYVAPQRAPGVGTAAKQGFGWAAGCLLFVVVLVVGLLVVLGSRSPRTSPGLPPAAPHAQAQLLTLRGNGIQRTTKFTTSGDWRIDWTYDCSSFGTTGNFIVEVQGDTLDVAVNQLGARGSGSAPEYTSPGTYYLEVNSECVWTVTVFG